MFHSRNEIEAITGYSKRNVGNLIPKMLEDLLEIEPDITPGKPLSEVVRFANWNWEFFLDEVVRARTRY